MITFFVRDDAREGQGQRPEPHVDLALPRVLVDRLGELGTRHAGRDALDVKEVQPDLIDRRGNGELVLDLRGLPTPLAEPTARAGSVRRAMGRFDGRVALVTGAGSPTGIGFATARLLGAEGARVALTSTTDRIYGRASRLEAEGIDVAAFTADLTDESQAETLVDAVLERFGQIDVLVNNAGLAQSGVERESARPVAELDAGAFERELSLNLWTAFHVTRAVLPGMLERRYGRVVMVGSVTGPIVVNPEGAGYATAKAGMDGLMR